MTTNTETRSIVLNSFKTARNTLDAFLSSPANIDSVTLLAQKIADTLRSGNKLISCGNGGSMCDAMHFAEEFTGRFRNDRRSLPAIAISDPSHLTCTANDYGFDAVFSRYIEGLGNSGDLLLGLSTSGNSPNIVKAVQTAKEKNIFTVGLLGKSGGDLKTRVDLPIVVPAETSDRIQEIHIKIIHITIEAVEALLNLA
ncbi:D-sedoheptulose 7-phosphate isomerase [bacterium]|nr:D-sedoheptulose 7-phosphate isomerase [bacterium]